MKVKHICKEFDQEVDDLSKRALLLNMGIAPD